MAEIESKSDSERFVQVNNARLWTCKNGSGLPLLVFNGGPGCDDYLGPVARLIDDVCQVIRFEPRGCGRSDWDGMYDVETLIEDAEAIRRAYGVDKWIVAGHSFGPDLALAYTLRYRRNVLGLIGIAGGRIVNDRTWHATYRENLASVGEDLGSVVFHADPRVNPDCNASWREFIKNASLLRKIAELDLPATYVFGSEDIRPTWPTQQLAALLPNGEYSEIVGAAHSIWLTQANELQQHLHRAIKRIQQFHDALQETK